MKRCLFFIVTLGLLVGCSQNTSTTETAPSPSPQVRVKFNDLNKVQALFPDGDIKKAIGNYWVVRCPDGSVWCADTGDNFGVYTNLLFGPMNLELR